MRSGTAYAARLRVAYAKHRSAVPNPEIPEPVDLIRCLAVATVGIACGEGTAQRMIDRLLSTLVDWNEVRVSSAFEINEAMGEAISDGVARCQQLITVLQAIYDRENRLSLDRLRSLGRREARQYLEKLEGVDEYGAAYVLLWGLGAHAVPVNDRLLEALHEADLVHPAADRAEVQAFLERHVSAAETKEFCLVMRSFGAPKPDVKQDAKPARSRRAKGAAT